MAFQRTQLTLEQVRGLLFAALCLDAWEYIPRFVLRNRSKVDGVWKEVCAELIFGRHYDPNTLEWIICGLTELDAQSHLVARQLALTSELSHYQVLNIQKLVTIEAADLPEFMRRLKDCPNPKRIEVLAQGYRPGHAKMPFSQFRTLCQQMDLCSPELLDELRQHPVSQWPKMMAEDEERIHITDHVTFYAVREAM